MGSFAQDWWDSRKWLQLWVMALVLQLPCTQGEVMSQDQFHFTSQLYNATIPERAPSRSYITASQKMGIYITDPKVEVNYKIVDGDRSDIFKVEHKRVGDFVFLRIRTHTSSYGSLNRELISKYYLKVKATGQVTQRDVLTTYTNVIIRVQDKNDLSPLFDRENYNVTVSEDTGLHSTILTVSASDGDEGINAEVYYSLVTKTNSFTIHPTSGAITVTRPLNFYEKRIYHLIVTAQDRGPKSIYSAVMQRNANITIHVTQANFNAPEIIVKSFPNIKNTGTSGVVYSVLTVTDVDIGKNGEIKNVSIYNDPSGLFKVLPSKDTVGEYHLLYTNSQRESSIFNNFYITIKASDSGNPPKVTDKKIHVHIDDLNDFGAIFVSDHYQTSVPEDIPVGSSVYYVQPSVTNQKGVKPRLMYEITTGNDKSLFKIKKETGLIRTASLLDAETDFSVELVINAYDPKSIGTLVRGSATLTIAILDTNDNAPVFQVNQTNIVFDENTPEGTLIYKVVATDADQGMNAKVSYSITNQETLPFEIGHFTGDIKLTKSLDYETMRKDYRVVVRATDWGSPFSRESEILLYFQLQNVNDNSPLFEKVNCSGYLSREAPLGTDIVTTPAVDFDYSDLVYSIKSGNEDGCLEVDPSSGRLTLNCSMEEHTQDQRQITIVVSDGKFDSDPVFVNLTLVNNKKNMQLSNKDANVQCQTTDASERLLKILQVSSHNNNDGPSIEPKLAAIETTNDHAPQFNSTLSNTLEISESTIIGTSILKIGATDDDPGFNGLIQFALLDGDPYDQFKIDPFSGDIIVISKLDREHTPKYNLEIQISDMAEPTKRKSASTVISISLKDENDNEPEFEKDDYEASVFESILVNATVIQVIATDRDIGNNGEVVYSLAGDEDKFCVDSKSGIISVKKPLDREAQSVYYLPVRASDLGKKPLSSTATVKVILLDDNDNIPKFVPENYDIKIQEDIPVGTVVATIKAEDRDEGENGRLTYSLIYGVEDTFEIDSDTGVIRLIKPLDYETKQVYNISAHAEDGGTPSMVSACSINIEVVDVNENYEAPEFGDFVGYGIVKENIPVGSKVMTVTAHDPDADPQEVSMATPVTYSIREGSGLGFFSIDNEGIIRTSRVLDCESASYYWLTIYATDRGLVPLHTRHEVYIKVTDVNDNIPQMQQPIYFMNVTENTREGTVVGQVQGYDNDVTSRQDLSYSIAETDPSSYFRINRVTGVITTTRKRLDRERQEIHILQIVVSDSGFPVLSSTAHVVIEILDQNDKRPEFLEKVYRARVMAVTEDKGKTPLLRVTARDEDIGLNAQITYRLKGKKQTFGIDRNTGMIYAKGLLNVGSYDLKVQAFDNGKDKKKATARVRLEVLREPTMSPNSPKFPLPYYEVQLMENCKIGEVLDVFHADDSDGDKLWYSLTDGDPENQFVINPEYGNIVTAKKLDREKRDHYNLTVMTTDGIHQTSVKVFVTVLDINDNTPEFTEAEYKRDISESVAMGTSVLTISAKDEDLNSRLFYKLTGAANAISLQLFEIDSETGVISVKQALDREVMNKHVLTVMVRDQGVPSNRNFTRVTITVKDVNDHPPQFISDVLETNVFETSTIGTSVAQLTAIDQDKGINAEITYSIVSGNIDMAFALDGTLGIISVAKNLDKSERTDYSILVRATDKGVPPLSSTATVNIHVTMSNNAPPNFPQEKYVGEVMENSVVGSPIVTVKANSQSSVNYEIIKGNDNMTFSVNPNSGVVYLKSRVDYELVDFYNLTILATNTVGKSDVTLVWIHVLDANDNEPYFTKTFYAGNISENSLPDSLILGSDEKPLVVTANDDDTNENAQLVYEIVDEEAKEFFTITRDTGAIKSKVSIDREKFNKFEFLVHVTDSGKPQLHASEPARVVINVTDVNDNPPVFSLPEFRADILLPTASDVEVITMTATDADLDENANILYTIKDGNNDGKFKIDKNSGTVYVVNDTNMQDKYHLTIQASDGKYDTTASLVLTVTEGSDDFNLLLHHNEYKLNIQENVVVPQSLTVLQVASALNQPNVFTLLNGKGMFEVVRTSGVLQTTGKPFDREEKDRYKIIAQVEDLSGKQKPLHIMIHINILDENDNVPLFVNQPYDTVVSTDTEKGTLITQVSAIDKDAGLNGNVTYTIENQIGNKFKVDARTGHIQLATSLTDQDVDQTFTLQVQATDKGHPAMSSEATVQIRVVSNRHPVFEQYFYSVDVKESSPAGTPIYSLKAISPSDHKLIYSITDGDPYKEFTVDFNIGMGHQGPCIISLTTALDYESTKVYNLTVRGTDVLTGSYGEAKLQINVLDVNDKSPSFTHYKYTKVISEAAAFGTSVLKVTAIDEDSGINAKVHYDLSPLEKSRSVSVFQINPTTGVIRTIRLLDFEETQEYLFHVVATDGGMPALNMSVPVHIIVSDLNDNPPSFDQPTYSGVVKNPTPGLHVAKVTASDPDKCSQENLEYSIVGGNGDQIFQIDAKSGVISISPRKHSVLYPAYMLNVSVSDGVFTGFTTVSITLENNNAHSPIFTQVLYQASVMENVGRGIPITTVKALDEDRGYYGMITYSVLSSEMRQSFNIDADTGEIFAERLFDRELQSSYSITIAATDNGGRMGFTTVIIDITDVNDVAPEFLHTGYKVSVPMNAGKGRPLVQIQARDPDLGDAGRVTYNIYDASLIVAGTLFTVDPSSGILSVKTDLSDRVDQVFQFFVEAVDHGSPQLKNNVPIEIYISNDEQDAPLTKPETTFIIAENKQVGSIIGKVVVVTKAQVDFSIIPGSTKDRNSPETFGINNEGEIFLLDLWRVQKVPQYKFTVQIARRDNPQIVAHSQITVIVSNFQSALPNFETSLYAVSVAEDQEKGTSVVQCRLLSEGKFITNAQYKFDHQTTVKYEHLFEINEYTGWINLVSELDRETREVYNLTVLAEQKFGSTTKIVTNTTVTVTVSDCNDNPPIFSQPHYQTAVNEDALSGTVFLALKTTDADANRAVEYFIVDGDTMGRFKIHKNGDIYVTKPLDRETVPHYELTVAATDGALESTAKVSVEILDANDNAPVCDEPIHQHVLSEDVGISTIITQVKATDADSMYTPNGEIHYVIKGEMSSDLFTVNREKGILTPKTELDREKQSHHHVVISAVDGGGLSCDIDVYIELSDVNDNAPTFVDLPEKYGLLESASVNTLLLRITAEDPDLGINRQVRYGMTDGEETFSIDSQSGIIQLIKPVDREQISLYKLNIFAYDQGIPSLTTTATLTIEIQDENDNPPEFVLSQYSAAVPENATVGTEVVKVLATSKDIGLNAKMTYSITAGNNNKKFVIDESEGVIRVANDLDREVTAVYFLTVMATDLSDTPLSSSTYVTVNISDINDNRPFFSQASYRISLPEDMPVGKTVFEVNANDFDEGQNSLLTFSIIEGDSWHSFEIHPVTGEITIRAPLDREMVDKYKLVVEVKDSGLPPLSSTTFVTMEIEDVNDCAPLFSESSYNATVQEDQYIGYKIIHYTVTDNDLDPNGPPFTFDIVSGNEGQEFRIEPTGILSTAGKFNRDIRDSYTLTVRVFDNGTPNLYSDVITTINIIEEGMNPPEVKNLEISISSYDDSFPGGVIGKVDASDKDIFDTLSYQVVSANRHLFDVGMDDGRIIAYPGLDSGSYIVNVSVSDKRNIAYGTVRVDVLMISFSMLESSVTMQIQDLSPEQFLVDYQRNFQKAVKRALNVRANDVQIINVQASSNLGSEPLGRVKRSADQKDLDVLFAVQRSANGAYFRRKKLERKLRQNLNDIESELNVRVVKVFGDVCPQESCRDGKCIGVINFNKSLATIKVEGKSFVTAKHSYSFKCLCSNGIEDVMCPEEHDTCAAVLCPTHQVCRHEPYQNPRCVCPEGRSGELCENEDKCTDASCLNGIKPMTFSGNSFAKWTLKEEFTIEKRLSLSMRIKTHRPVASLMFATGDVDYSILEIYNGMVQYKFNYGSGAGLVMIPIHVDDGKWHTINVERNDKHAELTLDNKYTNMAIAPGKSKVLNLLDNDVFFGADVFISYNGYPEVRRGFDGCMEDIKLFNILLPLKGENAVVRTQEFQEVEFHCKNTLSPPTGSSICSVVSCSNGGVCVPYPQYGGYEHYTCQCPERYEGNQCEIDRDPCANNPCGGNGECLNVKDLPNEFLCRCRDNYQGQFCRYGKYCHSSPCKNGGSCIEGPSSFMCHCPPEFAGQTCEDLWSEVPGTKFVETNIDSDDSGITNTTLYIIVGVTGSLVFLAILFVGVQCYRRRLSRTGRNVTLGIAYDDERDVMLKSRKDTCKVSDFDISKFNTNIPPSPQPPPVPNRPASYTPSNHDSLNTLNNLDNFHNYGSAADELENCHNIPYLTQEFLSFHGPPPRSNASVAPSLPPPPPSNPPSDTDSLQKATWEGDCPNMLENLEEKKHPEKFPRMPRQGFMCPDTTSFSSLPVSESEDEPAARCRKKGKDYHWDASDWAPRPSLPNISEVPIHEIHDSPSSSPHSNESNTHIGFPNGPINDSVLYTDPELLESEYVGDSEFADNEYDNEECYMSPPNYRRVLGLPQTPEEEEESYELPQHQIITHPNQYLPNHSFTQSHEQVSGDRDSHSDWPEPPSCDENEFYTSDNDEEVVTYGFPNTKKLAPGFVSDGGITDSEYNVRNSVIDRMSMSLGGYASTNASVSDISGLCEIEDSEVNLSEEESCDDNIDESTPLNNPGERNTNV
ncbi:protocadherin Fat 1-like isoform X2 [Saccostrea echinata]|uniref:protocadherin Fat 1-like isoform X2 n=1 Tax=Saccostrea echinata TaxID=191078 RepID=UPI002A80A13C|nr:protocadherin Fat 1-like isoform X2 [Saccostrea echinata]